jgi:uncharacterized membrane protein
MTEQVTRSIIIKGSPNELYNLWADLEQHPNFAEDLKSVTKIDEKLSRWVMKGPLGKEITWTTETTRDEQARRIAWRTLDGDIKTSGQVTFTPLPDDQTQVTVMMQYVPPAGVVGSTLAKVFDDPAGRVEKDLYGFKKYAENKYSENKY